MGRRHRPRLQLGHPPPGKPALAKLLRQFLKRSFRDGATSSHDSIEDARAAFDLAMLAMRKPVTEVAPDRHLPSLFVELLRSLVQIHVVAPAKQIAAYGLVHDRLVVVQADTTAELTNAFLDMMMGDVAPLTVGFFPAVAKCDIGDESESDACRDINEAMGRIASSLPRQSLLIVHTGNRNFRRLKQPHEPDMSTRGTSDKAGRMAEFMLCREGMLWVVARNGDQSLGC